MCAKRKPPTDNPLPSSMPLIINTKKKNRNEKNYYYVMP